MSIGRLEMEMPRLMSTLTTANISSRVLSINNLPEHKLWSSVAIQLHIRCGTSS